MSQTMIVPTEEQFIPDVVHVGMDEIRERIACALATHYESINVERRSASPSRWTLRCWGSVRGRRFFAKLFLTQSYPVPPRFRAPWEEGQAGRMESRPVSEQIEIEWTTSLKMRELSNGMAVPVPLGQSREAKTIVWEEARGIRLDQLAARSLWTLGREEAGIEALFCAGQWLRRVHEASATGVETIDLRQVTRWLTRRFATEREEARKYIATAILIARGLIDRLGEERIQLPTAFAHGDFCLANLLWQNGGSLAVVDFELAGHRPALCDLFAIVSHLRAQMLNPLVPQRTIQRWESSFWKGYGELPAHQSLIVRSLALARIYYHHLPRLFTRGQRRGRIAGFDAWLYRAFLERFVTGRRFAFPPELEAKDLPGGSNRASGAACLETQSQ